DRADPVHVYDHEPHHHHGGARADRLYHGAGLRLLEERLEILQAVRAERHPDLHPAADCLHRSAVLHLAPDLAFGAVVRKHARRPHHTESVRRLRRDARGPRLSRLARRDAAAHSRRRAHRARASGRLSAGLRVRDPDLHLSQRRHSSGPLRLERKTSKTSKRSFKWIQLQRSISVPALPASAWAAPVSAWVRFSAITLPPRSATRRPRRASSAT